MFVIRTSLLLVCVLLHACSVTSEADRETCYSRQHRGVTVNIRLALTKGAVMIPREKPSEKDCILTCCSEDVKPGVKCNLVVYKPVEESSGENCHLFNCPSEQDCPLMVAAAGVNTYNIFRGLTHPTTKVNGRTTAKPATAVNTQPSTTTLQPTTSRTITTPQPTTSPTTPRTITTPQPTTSPTTPRTITTPQPTTSPTTPRTITTPQPTTSPTTPRTITTPQPTTSPTTPRTITTPQPTTTTITTSAETEEVATETHVLLLTTHITSTTTTTQSTSTVTKARAHQRPAVKPNRKPNKPMRGPESHSFKPSKAKTPTIQPTTTTPTSTTITTSSSSSAVSPVVLLNIESKVDVSSALRKARFSRTMWKNSLVAVVVIVLVFLLLILALVARKAMESFDRRHYTRLELNDLHYEV